MAAQTQPFEEKLFNQLPEGTYESQEKYQAHLLEQYKLYVEMADKIAARRQTANSFFLTVNSALLGFVGYIGAKDLPQYVWLLGVAGVVMSYTWQRLIRSYQGLNTGKFNVVHAIEKRLPLSPYDAEWEAVGRGKEEALYKPFTDVELNVPWVFVLVHSFVVVRYGPWKVMWDFVIAVSDYLRGPS